MSKVIGYLLLVIGEPISADRLQRADDRGQMTEAQSAERCAASYYIYLIDSTTLPHQLPQELKVALCRLLYQEYACDVESSQDLENAVCYHIERQDCFDRPESDSDSLDA